MGVEVIALVTAYRCYAVAKRFPLHPANPHRICWGCDKYCPANAMTCGNGSVRAQHPAELFGDDWYKFGLDATVSNRAPSSHQTR